MGFFDEMKEEFKDVDATTTTFEILPVQDYIVKLEDWTWGKSKNKGTRQMAGVFTILSGDYKGRKIFKTWYFTEKSLPWALKDFALLEGKPVSIDDLETMKLDQPVKLVKNSHREYDKADGSQGIAFEVGFINNLKANELDLLDQVGETSDDDDIDRL